MYIYKYVSAPKAVAIGKKDSHTKVNETYANFVNEIAADGWEYVGIDTVDSVFQSGCLASIPVVGAFFRQDEAVNHKMLIFKKAK